MRKQLLPICLSLSLFAVFSGITYLLILWINTFDAVTVKLGLEIIWMQVLIGVFIYLKTAVDYSIFVGQLMDKNSGIPKRIAMNAGTQVGCFLGVTAIVVLWAFFKEIHWLMFILLIVAACILFRLGDGSQEHFASLPKWLRYPLELFFNIVRPVANTITFFMPKGGIAGDAMDTGKLFFFSAIIPFALGADDLAGYMVLLAPVSAFSILIGIYFGDAIIDIFLFCNQEFTIKAVKNRWVSYVGALFFIGLGVLSVVDAIHLYI